MLSRILYFLLFIYEFGWIHQDFETVTVYSYRESVPDIGELSNTTLVDGLIKDLVTGRVINRNSDLFLESMSHSHFIRSLNVVCSSLILYRYFYIVIKLHRLCKLSGKGYEVYRNPGRLWTLQDRGYRRRMWE